MSGAAVLAASTGGWLLAPTAAEASPSNDPYDIATWKALAGERLTLRAHLSSRPSWPTAPLRASGGRTRWYLGRKASWATPKRCTTAPTSSSMGAPAQSPAIRRQHRYRTLHRHLQQLIHTRPQPAKRMYGGGGEGWARTGRTAPGHRPRQRGATATTISPQRSSRYRLSLGSVVALALLFALAVLIALYATNLRISQRPAVSTKTSTPSSTRR